MPLLVDIGINLCNIYSTNSSLRTSSIWKVVLKIIIERRFYVISVTFELQIYIKSLSLHCFIEVTTIKNSINKSNQGGLAQLARAFDWQSKGHRLDRKSTRLNSSHVRIS